MRRIKGFGIRMSSTTKNILQGTYLFAKVGYGMAIMWDLITKTRRNKIETMLRSCTKSIRECTIQSENKMFETVTNYEPLGLKALQRMIKIWRKMAVFYPEEQEAFTNQENNEEYWRNYTKICCPELEEEVNINDTTLMIKDRVYRKRKICLMYWKKKQ